MTGLLLLMAGYLLLLPGLATDVFGVALLFPTVRQYTVKLIK